MTHPMAQKEHIHVWYIGSLKLRLRFEDGSKNGGRISSRYGLAVQAGFYGDVVEWLISDLVALVRSPAGAKVISIFSSPELKAHG